MTADTNGPAIRDSEEVDCYLHTNCEKDPGRNRLAQLSSYHVGSPYIYIDISFLPKAVSRCR